MKIFASELRSVIRLVLSEDNSAKNESLKGWEVDTPLGSRSRDWLERGAKSDSEVSAGLIFPIRKRDRPNHIGEYNLNRPPIPSLAAQYAPDGPSPNARLYARYNNVNKHEGIDIGVPIGTDVLAPTGGQISSAGGHTMRLEGEDGREYVFHHLDSFSASVGSSVSAGSVIAKSGNKQPSTAPHLHFGVKVGGRYIDPMTLWGVSSIAAIPDASRGIA